jgi:hypothetical protein
MGREAYGSLLRFAGHMAQAQFMVRGFGNSQESIVATWAFFGTDREAGGLEFLSGNIRGARPW